MKFSLNSIKEINRRDECAGDIAAIGVEKLSEKIGAQLGAIEETIPLGETYHGIVIVKVVSCVDHPNADRLHVCKIDDGAAVADVERDENGYVQVVCGAPNVRSGLLVAWLPPGSTVPESVGKEPFVLSVRDIRGQTSNGMLASPKELALSDNHEGILEIDGDYKPGTDFAEAFGLKDDVIFDIENKMFTHRPDCFGFLGIARELAGIQSMPFKSPAWYIPSPQFPDLESEELTVAFSNELPDLVPRFSMIAMSNIQVGASPVWLQVELAKVGMRPINNIVDYTNFFMLETGQPLHAYDYDKVKALSDSDGVHIVVRNPKPKETLKLLNGKTIEPRAEAIMIATDKQLIGVGGVMGGADTEVDENTKNVLLECANFDMYSVRRTSMEHGLFTDALTRFNKGQSPLQNLAVLAKIVDQIRLLPGGKVASHLMDYSHLEQAVIDRQSLHPPVKVSADFINDRLGLSLSADEMKVLLENVEFRIEVASNELQITAPFWRTDIELREDIVEEIGRLYGYDKLPLDLPRRDIVPAHKDDLLALKSDIRAALAKAGANEILTYSFVHGDLLEKSGQNKELAFRVSNALSPGLQFYRLSLTPSLLEKVHPNIKAGYAEFALFELGKVHETSSMDENGLPEEFDNVALVYANKSTIAGAPYYEAQRFLSELAKSLGIGIVFQPIGENSLHSLELPFEAQRSAHIQVVGSNQSFGIVGELTAGVRKKLKLPPSVAAFELNINELLKYRAQANSYIPLSRYPKVEQDICLKVSNDLKYQDLFDFLEAEFTKMKPENSTYLLHPIDIYQREDDREFKQVTYRLSISRYDKTMTDVEVNVLLDQLAESAKTKFGAERI